MVQPACLLHVRPEKHPARAEAQLDRFAPWLAVCSDWKSNLITRGRRCPPRVTTLQRSVAVHADHVRPALKHLVVESDLVGVVGQFLFQVIDENFCDCGSDFLNSINEQLMS